MLLRFLLKISTNTKGINVNIDFNVFFHPNVSDVKVT